MDQNDIFMVFVAVWGPTDERPYSEFDIHTEGEGGEDINLAAGAFKRSVLQACEEAGSGDMIAALRVNKVTSL